MNLLFGLCVIAVLFLVALGAGVLESKHRAGRIDRSLVAAVFFLLFLIVCVFAFVYLVGALNSQMETNLPGFFSKLKNG